MEHAEGGWEGLACLPTSQGKAGSVVSEEKKSRWSFLLLDALRLGRGWGRSLGWRKTTSVWTAYGRVP